MKAITYEIERWIEIRIQRESPFNPARWYIWNDLTQCEYLRADGLWYQHSPAFFETPEVALAFWNSTKAARNNL